MDELNRIPSVDVMYVAELEPPTADGAQVYDIDVINRGLNKEKIVPTSKTHTFTFKKLDKDKKYSVRVRTLVNGRTIVCVSIFQSLFYKPCMDIIRVQKNYLREGWLP